MHFVTATILNGNLDLSFYQYQVDWIAFVLCDHFFYWHQVFTNIPINIGVAALSLINDCKNIYQFVCPLTFSMEYLKKKKKKLSVWNLILLSYSDPIYAYLFNSVPADASGHDVGVSKIGSSDCCFY